MDTAYVKLSRIISLNSLLIERSDAVPALLDAERKYTVSILITNKKQMLFKSDNNIYCEKIAQTENNEKVTQN